MHEVIYPKRPWRTRIWFYKPWLARPHWRGLKHALSVLNPFGTGGDEYDWHTITLGYCWTGRIIVATRHCPEGPKCVDDDKRWLTNWPIAHTASIFLHDCDNCVYLGHWHEEPVTDDSRIADLYWCAQSGFPTVIARFSDEGSDYTSGMVAAPHIPALAEAKRLAELVSLPT